METVFIRKRKRVVKMKKWFSLLLVVSLILAACGSAAAEEPQVWYQCGPYRYILLEDGAAKIEKYSGEEATVIIPAELDGKKVTAVGENAFVPENPWDTTSWQGPQSVVIPEGVTKIENGAFSYCGNLKSVTIPESVVSIGDLVLFYSGGTAGLSLTIPDGLVYLGSCTHPDFSDEQIRKLENHPCLEVKDGMLFSKQDSRLICCLFPDQVTHADIPEGTRIIGDYAFAYSNLESVTIPDTVTAIGSLCVLFFCAAAH